jgi:hypothetical protein
MALAAFLRPAPGSSLPLPHLPACSPKEKELNRSPQRRRGNHDSRFRRGATVLFHAEDAEEHSAAKPQPNFWGDGTPRVLVTAEDAKPNRTHTTRRSGKFL